MMQELRSKKKKTSITNPIYCDADDMKDFHKTAITTTETTSIEETTTDFEAETVYNSTTQEETTEEPASECTTTSNPNCKDWSKQCNFTTKCTKRTVLLCSKTCG